MNAIFRKVAEGSLKGVLDVYDVPLVSVDFRCTNVSSNIDSSLTLVMGDGMVKVVAWYDNEWGYSQRVVDLAHLVAAKWPGTPDFSTSIGSFSARIDHNHPPTLINTSWSTKDYEEPPPGRVVKKPNRKKIKSTSPKTKAAHCDREEAPPIVQV
ncbi:unnamed protein product [Lupinus luteus]|uniref:Glyceraldehyde 3-phosphate dehydrogenase catalytic domain-containing protein n=1 Tax=Lupinus luteus TaxID=3873 RepID=A0AAV1YMP5_LUPLU